MNHVHHIYSYHILQHPHQNYCRIHVDMVGGAGMGSLRGQSAAMYVLTVL